MNNTLSVMQGDQYGIPFEITDKDGNLLTDASVDDVEIVIGDMRKTLADGEITYSEADGAFLFPLTQKESFAMAERTQRVQVRVKIAGTDTVIGEDLGHVQITYAKSKEVL